MVCQCVTRTRTRVRVACLCVVHALRIRMLVATSGAYQEASVTAPSRVCNAARRLARAREITSHTLRALLQASLHAVIRQVSVSGVRHVVMPVTRLRRL